MTTNRYTVGTLVRVISDITAVEGDAPVDPTSVELHIILPDSSLVDLTGSIVNDAVGEYHADYLPTQVGLYRYEWIGLGDAQVAQVGSFIVNQSVQ